MVSTPIFRRSVIAVLPVERLQPHQPLRQHHHPQRDEDVDGADGGRGGIEGEAQVVEDLDGQRGGADAAQQERDRKLSNEVDEREHRARDDAALDDGPA